LFENSYVLICDFVPYVTTRKKFKERYIGYLETGIRLRQREIFQEAPVPQETSIQNITRLVQRTKPHIICFPHLGEVLCTFCSSSFRTGADFLIIFQVEREIFFKCLCVTISNHFFVGYLWYPTLLSSARVR